MRDRLQVLGYMILATTGTCAISGCGSPASSDSARDSSASRVAANTVFGAIDEPASNFASPLPPPFDGSPETISVSSGEVTDHLDAPISQLDRLVRRFPSARHIRISFRQYEYGGGFRESFDTFVYSHEAHGLRIYSKIHHENGSDIIYLSYAGVTDAVISKVLTASQRNPKRLADINLTRFGAFLMEETKGRPQ